MTFTFNIKNIYHAAYYKTQHAFDIVLIIISLLLATASFLVLLGATPIELSRAVCIAFICVNLFFVLLLCFTIVYRVFPIVKSWQVGRAAARLHFRIITLFSVVASLPALAVAIVAVVTFNMGLDRWFNNNTQQIVNSSINIANVYAAEMLNSLEYNSYYMERSLDNETLLRTNLLKYKRLMTMQAAAYRMKAAFLLSENGKIYVSSYLGDEKDLPIPPKSLIDQAKAGRPFAFQPGKHDYFGVIVKLNNIKGTYLYVIRDVHSSVLNALRLTEYNTNRYKYMQEMRVPLQIAFAVLYLCLFLAMWLSAILTGLKVANRLVRPIRRLIGAADKVAMGQLNVSLPVDMRDDDVAQLSKTFNYMVVELKDQRDALLLAKDIIDERRRFTEAVLSGVSAGILGINAHGKITIINKSFEKMFNFSCKNCNEYSIETLTKEIGAEKIQEVFEKARLSYRCFYTEQVTINASNHMRVYNVQITGEEGKTTERSWVVTIDDITDLVEAHRSLAWADVARRIAHEIKNPLTPIQLSAERINRRYSKFITQDKEIFDKCIETIIRQVNDIGRLVSEFSGFARMPKPKMEKLDIKIALNEACFLIEVSKNDIKFIRNLGKDPLYGNFDARLITQAFGNIIKNASESIDSTKTQGTILIQSYKKDNMIIVEIIDNGKGWPQHKREELLEPYITTRAQGSGLGLAIVRKIVEEHKGTMELLDAPLDFCDGQGAMVKMMFPIYNNLELD